MKLNQTLTFNFHLFQPILEGTVDQGSKWPSILVRIHTYIQSLNIPLCAISRQVFGREKCFQYSIRMFLLCSKRRVVKLCKYHDTSGSNFKALWATYLTALKHQNSLNYHHRPAPFHQPTSFSSSPWTFSKSILHHFIINHLAANPNQHILI